MSDQARPIKRARFLSREAFADDERRSRPPAYEPRGERQRKTHRYRSVRRLSGHDFMQSVVCEPAAKRRIERARERQAPRWPLALRAGFSLDLGDGAPQTRHPLRSAAWRHSVRALLFVICSCFGPDWGKSQDGRRHPALKSGHLAKTGSDFISVSDRDQGPRVVSINRQLRYETLMTELLERAVQSLRGLPPETQDALARILQQLVGDDPSIVTLSAEEKASFQTSFAQAGRGEFATEDQIKAVWAKHGL